MKLSIIIPVYNSEKYLRQCLDSVANQSYEKMEVILVNDGSTDDSERICLEFCKSYNFFKYITKENGGPLSALREGLKVASGDYLGFVDSDDWIDNDMYKVMMSKVLSYQAEIVVVGYRTFSEHGEFLNTITESEGFYDRVDIERKIIPSLINRGALRERSCIYLSRINKVFKRELLIDNIQYFLNDSIRYGEDNLMTISTVLDAKSVYICSDYYPYHYRVESQSSLTHKYHTDLWQKFRSLCDTTLAILNEKGYSEQTEQVYNDYIFLAVSALINARKSPFGKKKSLEEMKVIIDSDALLKNIDVVVRNEKNIFKKFFLRCVKHKRYRMVYMILGVIK